MTRLLLTSPYPWFCLGGIGFGIWVVFSYRRAERRDQQPAPPCVRREPLARTALQERAAVVHLRPRSGNVDNVIPIRRPRRDPQEPAA